VLLILRQNIVREIDRDTIRHMTRRFLFLLISIVAFQFIWNAASAYCGHETGKPAQHFGHHAHETGAEESFSVSKSDSKLKTKSIPHMHCSLCVHGIAFLDEPPAHLLCAVLLGHVSSATDPRLPSIYQSPPERPQWSLPV